MQPLALTRGGGELKCSAWPISNVDLKRSFIIFKEDPFIPKQSAAERRDVTNTSALTKRVVRSVGADSLAIKRARKIHF